MSNVDVVEFQIARSLGARLNTASGTPLHCPRRTKLTKSIELGFDAPAQNFNLLFFLTYWNIIDNIVFRRDHREMSIVRLLWL